MAKIKKGDLVLVISGRDKGRQGRVLEVLVESQRLVVEGVQRVQKHVKAGQTQRGTRTGGIETVEAPIHISNVMLVDPETKKAPGSATAPSRSSATAVPAPFGSASPSAPVRTSDDRDHSHGSGAPASEVQVQRRDQDRSLRAVLAREHQPGRAPGEGRREHGRRRGRQGLQAHRGRDPRPDPDHGPEAAGHQARKSIAQFKLREGMPIGAHVTLRGDRAWEFLDRLLSTALPRIRDFRGLSPQQFDGHGNYTFGLVEQSVFHEIDQDKIDRVRGMDITVVTTADTDDEGRAFLKLLGFPFKEI